MFRFLSDLKKMKSYSEFHEKTRRIEIEGAIIHSTRTECSGTKLFWAANNNQLIEAQQLLDSAKELGILMELMSQKANVTCWMEKEKTREEGITALEIAIEKGHTMIIETLQKAGTK